ncbi:MAG: ATP-binding protein [Pseudomonadota bacterium]
MRIPKENIVFIIATIIALFMASPAHAQNTSETSSKTRNLILTDRYSEHFLSPYLSSYEIYENSSLSDIIEAPGKPLNEGRNPNKIIYFGSKDKSGWLGFDVINRSSQTHWGLNLGSTFEGKFGLFNNIEIYTFSQGFEDEQSTVVKNQYRSSDGIYHIRLEPSQKSRVLIQYTKATGIPMTVPLKIVEIRNNHVFESHKSVYLFIAFLTGLAFFFVAVSFINSQYEYLYFSLYYGVLVVILMIQNGIIFNPELFGSRFLILCYYFLGIAALLTARIFWNIKERSKVTRLPYYALLYLSFISVLAGFYIFDTSSFLQSLYIFGPILSIFLIIPFISAIFSQEGKDETTPYMFGWCIFLFGIIITLLPFFNVMQPVSTAINAYLFSLIPQAIFFTIAVKIRNIELREEDIASKTMVIEETSTVSTLRQSKEANEQERLLKVIEQERKVLTELRKSEAKKTNEMRVAKEDADKANKAKSAFLAVVTHEIRTPMTGIMGMVKLLLDSSLSKDQKTYAQTIQDSGDAMLALLNDILDFEKIEQGKMSFENITFDIHRLISGVSTLMNGHAAQKHIELKTKLGDTLPQYVQGDPTRLRQVLLNLTGNAVKFTDEGHVTITAERIDNMEEEGIAELYFSVTDSGIGISEEAQKNLFNPFSQADNSIARKFGGTGLGLAISKGLIRAMGSEININSHEGEGSTFFFMLKMPLGEQSAAEEMKRQEPVSDTTKALKILIVDDNQINQNVIKGLLKSTPHSIQAANRAESGLDMLKKEEFDFVLMDIELPGMKGDEATQKIRADEKLKDIPVVALTGNLMPDEVKQYLAAGMNDVLAKPIDPDKLLAVLSRNFNTHKEKKKQNDNNEVLNEQTLQELAKHISQDEMKTMLDDVMEKSGEIIEAIKDANNHNDLSSIAQRCHEIKGMCGNFGLNELSDISNKIERAIKDNDSDGAQQDIKQLDDTKKRAEEALSEWFDNYKAAH